MAQAPYGTWSSPITAEAITAKTIRISDIIVDAKSNTAYHIENRPSEAGRAVLVNTHTAEDVVPPGVNVRSGVHEYGGGGAVIHSGTIYYSDYSDGRLYATQAGGVPVAVTPENGKHRFADMDVHPTHSQFIISVIEDHSSNVPSQVVNSLALVDSTIQSVAILVAGADFYASPRFSPDGKRLLWVEWYQPDMPWEGAEIWVADVIVTDQGVVSLDNKVHVAGERINISVAYPSWANNDTLLFTSDESGYQNPHKCQLGQTAIPVFAHPILEDFGDVAWSLGGSPYAIVDHSGKYGVFASFRDGRNILYLVDITTGERCLLDCPYVVMQSLRSLSRSLGEFVFVGGKVNEGKALVKGTIAFSSPPTCTFTRFELDHPGVKFGLSLISEPQPMTLTLPDGGPLYVVYYPPHNPEYTGPSIINEKPPCIVSTHGGPTGIEEQVLQWYKQFFTTRGFAWLDVNFRGSSGYGRAYIKGLEGQWGVVDVEDTVYAAKALGKAPYELIDKERVVVRGGSSGGYTTLASLCNASDLGVFAAGTSLYGISDLAALVGDDGTHKFESRYGDKLLGTADKDDPIYRERSPVSHLDQFVSPLLLLQGDLDRVVPKKQSEMIYERLRARGIDVEYVLYEGEGHGFRQEKTLRDSLERELAFYKRILKLE